MAIAQAVWQAPVNQPYQPRTVVSTYTSHSSAPAVRHRLAAAPSRPIRVLVADDHPAVGASITRLLDEQPDIAVLGTATSAGAAVSQAQGVELDVVVCDYYLPGQDGLSLVAALKQLVRPPAALLYSAYACPEMTVAALLVGADGILSKSTPADALCNAIRAVADGRKVIPPLLPSAMLALGARLDADDARLCGMLIDGATRSEIAARLGISEAWIEARCWAILERLRCTLRRG